MTAPLVLDGGALDIADVAAVARDYRTVALSPEVSRLLARSRAVVERWQSEDRPIYGVTRGLGGRVVEPVAAADRDPYSRQMLLGRASGAGPPLSEEVVRAALFVRVATLARGGAGVRPVIAERLIAFLNRRLHPRVPSIGSIGASDLALMANLALPVIGENFRGAHTFQPRRQRRTD